jgi:hypothetical protein
LVSYFSRSRRVGQDSQLLALNNGVAPISFAYVGVRTTIGSVKVVPVFNVDEVFAAIPVHLVHIAFRPWGLIKAENVGINTVVTKLAGDLVFPLGLLEDIVEVGSDDIGRIMAA